MSNVTATTKFNIMTSSCTVVINPLLLEDWKNSIKNVSLQLKLPIKSYSITTSYHAALDRVIVIDKNFNKYIVHFSDPPKE